MLLHALLLKNISVPPSLLHLLRELCYSLFQARRGFFESGILGLQFVQLLALFSQRLALQVFHAVDSDSPVLLLPQQLLL